MASGAWNLAMLLDSALQCGGTQYAGSGYCRIKNGKQYIPAKNGTSCPSGSMYSGAGYCKVR